MEPKQNYFAVGLFVIIGGILLAVTALWIMGRGDSDNYGRYQMFFSESVTGLDEGAAVRYRGVRVGNVHHITIDPNNATRIRVVVNIEKTTPVHIDTFAVLRTVGITGIPYVQLETENNDSALMPPGNRGDKEENLPTIITKPSQLTQLVNAVPQILGNLSKFADKLGKMMEGENGEAIDMTIANVNKAVQSFGETSVAMNAALADVRAAMTQFTKTAATIDGVAMQSRDDLQKTLAATADAMERFNKLIEKTSSFSDTGYAEAQATLIELKKTAREISTLTKELKKNPSQIVIPPKQGGVSIP